MKKKEATDKSTEVPVGELVPQPHGGALRNGGTNKGGSGRPPDLFKRRLRQARDRKQVHDYLKKCLDGGEGPQAFLKAISWVTTKVDGKEDTVSRPELYRILGEMGMAVNAYAEEHIVDEEVRAAFLKHVRDAWLGIRLA